MSDPEFLAHMWTRAVNCGTECFVTLHDMGRLQDLASLNSPERVLLHYKDHHLRTWTRDCTTWLRKKRMIYATVYSMKPLDLRDVVLLGMQRDGRFQAGKVARTLEASK